MTDLKKSLPPLKTQDLPRTPADFHQIVVFQCLIAIPVQFDLVHAANYLFKRGGIRIGRLFSIVCLSAVGIMAFCFQATGSPERLNVRSPLSRCTLPEPARLYLANNPEGFEPIEKNDYSSLLLKYVIDHEGDYIQWLLCADFDGNGREDYALIAKKEGKISLVVVRTLRDRFACDILEADVENMPCDLTLKLHPPGPTRMGMVDDRDPPVKKLRNPAIISSTAKTDDDRLWYWEKGSWHRVYVGL